MLTCKNGICMRKRIKWRWNKSSTRKDTEKQTLYHSLEGRRLRSASDLTNHGLCDFRPSPDSVRGPVSVDLWRSPKAIFYSKSDTPINLALLSESDPVRFTRYATTANMHCGSRYTHWYTSSATLSVTNCQQGPLKHLQFFRCVCMGWYEPTPSFETSVILADLCISGIFFVLRHGICLIHDSTKHR